MSSPSKRRKTSPTTSVPINAPTTPSRIPVPRQGGSRGLPGRPSFASPTKASLSRHHPQLLDRPKSSGGEGATGAEQDNVGEAPKDISSKAHPEKLHVPDGDGVAAGRVVDRDGAQPDSQAVQRVSNELRTANRSPASQVQAQETHVAQGGLSARPKRKSRSPLKTPAKSAVDLPGKPAPAGTGEEIDPFRRRGLRRSPVASQAMEILPDDPNPFKKSGLRRSPLPSQPSQAVSQIAETQVSTTPTAPIPPKMLQVKESVVQSSPQPSSKGKRASAGAWHELFPEPAAKPTPPTATQPEEAELPPTPTQRGIADPIVTTPPTGIHGVHAINETSSRRRKRKSTEGSKFTSSPLKPREGIVVEQVKQADTAQEAPQKGQQPQKGIQEQLQETSSGKQPDRRRSVRFLVPEDPYAAKKKLRDDLLQELQQLQSDLTLANAENERLRLHYESKSGPPPASASHSELLSLLQRTTEQPAKPTPKPQSIFDNIEMFLPFFSQIPKQVIEAQPEETLPSHLPLEVDNPLPYLQAFTPLTYTSNIFNITQPLSPDSSSASTSITPLTQRHIITARHPQGLFAARLLMDVDTSTFSISSVSLVKLDPAASFELGTFLNHHIDNETHLSKDMPVLCWAMARWTEVSVRRARFWHAVETELGSPEARRETLRKINARLGKRKRNQELLADDEAQNENDELGGDYTAKTSKVSRRHLLPHMGRTSMEISNSHVDIRIEWKLSFDWTGEVESVFDADVKVPGTWTHSDDRNSLPKIPELFRSLAKQKGAMSATKSVVALLMPEDET